MNCLFSTRQAQPKQPEQSFVTAYTEAEVRKAALQLMEYRFQPHKKDNFTASDISEAKQIFEAGTRLEASDKNLKEEYPDIDPELAESVAINI